MLLPPMGTHGAPDNISLAWEPAPVQWLDALAWIEPDTP
jgi:hypothetical protein